MGYTPQTGQALKVMLVDDDPVRARRIELGLQNIGLEVCATVANALTVLKRISDHQPDVILIDMESPGRDILESLSIVATHQPTPVVMFSEEQDPNYISRAVDAGVSTYLVGSIDPAKVRPVIEVAMAQFRSFQNLRQALDETRSELQERRRIDEAKRWLMQSQDLDETQAYEYMRKVAMDCGIRLTEVAERILDKQHMTVRE